MKREGYSVVFDKRSRFFSQDPGRNEMTLTQWQSWMNDKLISRGHVFLNEVLDSLGLPRVREGQSLGWLAPYHPEAKAGAISFGIERVADVVEFKLVFNVDGDILDALWPAKEGSDG